MRNKYLELPVFFYSDAQKEALDRHETLGIGKPEFEDYNDFEVRPVLFAGDIVIVPFSVRGMYIHTKIYCSGDYWICKLPYEAVKMMLDDI